MVKRILLLVHLGFAVLICAQKPLNEDAEYLIDRYKSYLPDTRTGIYLHLNKTVFVAGENIEFTTYIYHRKDRNLSLSESYVNVDLINGFGEVVSSKTVLYSMFTGFNTMPVNSNLPAGNYFLQAYTNSMSDFMEDDSSIYKIEILNFGEENRYDLNDSLLISDQIKIQPENGRLIQGIINTCALQITNTLATDSIALKDSEDNVISRIKVSEKGIGRFSFVPSPGKKYQVELNFGNKLLIKKLPSAKVNGLSLSVATDYLKRKLIISINRNGTAKQQNLSLIVHQEGKIVAYPVSLDLKESSKSIVLPFSSVFEGINTLNLFEGKTVLAERLVYINPKKPDLSMQLLQLKKQKDSLKIYFKNTEENESDKSSIISVSVLPDETISDFELRNLTSSLFLQGYVPDLKIPEFENWNSSASSDRLFAIDNLLILEGAGRYSWRDIMSSRSINRQISPNLSEIDGYVNLFGAKNDSLIVMLYSKESELFETAFLQGNKKFKFKDLKLKQGSKFSLTLLNQIGEPIYANFFFTINSKEDQFRHAFKPNLKRYEEKEAPNNQPTTFFKKAEELKEVTVSADRLKRKKLFANYFGQKIDSTILPMGTLENYIRSFGFYTIFVNPLHPEPRIAGTFQFVKKCRGDLVFSPMLNFNGELHRYAMNYSNIGLEFIDEIYYRSSERCSPAMFVVFTNERYRKESEIEALTNSKEFVVENGYDPPSSFVRPEYYSKSNRLYAKYGIISWKSKLISNEQGVVSLKIPDDGQSKLKLNFQGYSENNVPISNSLILNISEYY